jgi:hypothetical protein
MQCHLDAGLGTAALTGAYCPQLACHKGPPLRLQAVWCIGKLWYCSTAASCVPDIFGNADGLLAVHVAMAPAMLLLASSYASHSCVYLPRSYYLLHVGMFRCFD